MTRTICILGGKGGVGKTTLTSNLASALAELGKDVIAIDANLTTPNLGMHLGLHFAPNTIHQVLKGQ
jgi:septum site-determining protein MinD